jgi:hypothetical protein
MTYAMGYDPVNDAFIHFTTSGGNRALAFDATSGSFLASINLTGLISPNTSYGMGYTNDQFFIYDSAINAYRGFVITDGQALSSIPEPGTLILLLFASVPLLRVTRRRRTQSFIAG